MTVVHFQETRQRVVLIHYRGHDRVVDRHDRFQAAMAENRVVIVRCCRRNDEVVDRGEL